MTDYKINPEKITPFPHYWEMCVASCHAYTALREDYREQLTRAHKELGFRYIRFHGLFDDDMCVLVKKTDKHTGKENLVYNFVNIDNIYDFILRIGMKPFIELAFMPSAIARGEQTLFHYKANVTPPADVREWGKLVGKFVHHLLERYGREEVRSWYFEVWNEPNLKAFWGGTKEDYFDLYEASVNAIKEADSQLKVGGPATSCNMWIPDMLEFCKKKNLPIDFVSTHQYPTDDPLWKSGMNLEDFRKAGFVTKVNERGILKKMVMKAKQEADGLPLFYTEWNVSAVLGDQCHDTTYASSMMAKILADNDSYVDGYSHWTFSDIFEEGSQFPGVFHGGFGLMTYGGIPKPSYRLMELLHRMGEERLEVISSDENSTVEMLAVKSGKKIQVMLYNYDIAEEAPGEEEVVIDIRNLKVKKNAVVYRIDEQHSNAYELWKSMGSPEYIKKEDVEKLCRESELRPENMEIGEEIRLTVLPYAVIMMEMEEDTDE